MKFLMALCLLQSCLAQASQGEDLLKKLVEISSGTKQVEAVNQVQGIVKKELDALGFTTELKAPPANIKSGDLLLAQMKGANPKYITFVIHADTVFEPSSGFKDYKVSADGTTAYGPGVIDDKGGIIVLLEGLKQYLSAVKTSGLPYSLRVVSSPSEETGSGGFNNLFTEYSQDSALVLGFEPSLDNKNIVSGRKGNRWFLITVTGREAHAGRAHKDGINACVELAGKISQLSRLTDYQSNLTVSVGHIEGGQDKFNIVCGSASAKIDTRFETSRSRDIMQKHFDAILKKSEVQSFNDHESSKIESKIDSESPPYAKEEEAVPYLRTYVGIINRLEQVKITDEKSGGTADVNAFARSGLPIIDGLGAVGGKMHTKEEFITLSSLKTRSTALAEFLKSLP